MDSVHKGPVKQSFDVSFAVTEQTLEQTVENIEQSEMKPESK